ncbi:MAG: ABC transporter permease subunit [Deferribacteraceae bacterium]|jgi:phosphate transport system permease protein|nr:ABC transporter permease subunit [Deferribacteraceae bacterium]
MIRYYGMIISIAVTAVVLGLLLFIVINALPALPSISILKAPLMGTLRLLLLSCLIAAPMGLSLGVYMSEYANRRTERGLVTLFESLAGLPSIIVGLFGFIMILFIRKFLFPANTSLLLSAFCLAVLVLPALALNTYTALRGVGNDIRLSAAAVGLPKQVTIFKIIVPQASEGIISGVLLAAGRCAEDTAVIIMTGAVATTGLGVGILDKFEALPFFIYYTSANYQDENQLAQVFAASLLLLIITPMLIVAGTLMKGGKRR